MSSATPATIHASAVAIGEAGILIRGPSGSGKSSLALALMETGEPRAALVADDRVILSAHNGTLYGSVPETIAGLLEVRGLGILRRAFDSPTAIRLCVDLVPVDDVPRMPTESEARVFLEGVPVPRLFLAIASPEAALRVRVALRELPWASPPPIGPHYDWRAPNGNWYRYFPDGHVEPKVDFGGEPNLRRAMELGEPGRRFLARSLEKAGGVGEALKGATEKGGVVYAPVPTGASVERARQFEVGGLTRSDPIKWLSEHIRSLPAGYLLLQDVWAKPEDAKGALSVVSHGTVYQCLRSHEAGEDDLRKSHGQISSFLLIAVYLPMPEELSIPISTLMRETPDQLAARAQELFVSAYDQEGFVAWSRT